NLFQSLIISAGQVSKVITADEVKAVTLTGSEPAGSAVASLAGKLIKKTVLELGGSDPFIVLRDADLSKCADTAITARFLNGGQSCIAAKRFIVDASAAREFEKMIQNRMDKLIVGDPMNEKTDIGPLARPEFVNELDRQVQNSIRQGARLVTGGARGESPGNFYQPTLLCDVTDRMDVFQQETFGPVFVIIPVKDEKTAIKLANDSEFGLGASLWTKDPEKGEKLAAQINAGSVFINGMVKSDPRLPFGGIKKSGYGRELSHYGIREFVNIKTVWIQ
ncbi:MAG: aldehyde dehydrogenase family protein, partial [FCB group bacterium]|nr:aldehyde dehydrogenase family protein [FCB group bacterium]